MRKYKTYNDISDLEFLQCYRQMLSQMNSLYQCFMPADEDN
ncbi:hypothetical protein T11_6690 [Trichinella zimbabwensis]|uniref:Uncharacterized protein n=1 Tax=Trichinella zimbabwensis TaxID=268475 RepID=A0A0V1F321_9BILA|nr:hypothetical protein T11_6690 [Trichinella zimbabwensis]